ncbi:MAG: spore cortex-lytic enzyme, partial [Firmicutes bacterium]|nr:spore cortex-lytic enzyme [Bacillota bacterium]
AAVILNRIADPAFPKTIADIIYQPRAFSSVDDGQINLPPSASAIRAAQEAMNGSDPSGGAVFFFNPAKTSNKYIWSRPQIKQIGNHMFTK